MVAALDKKLLRDLSRMRGQVITIALVVACGIASYTTTAGAYESLLGARDDYYARYRFPDLFATLKRAPLSLQARLLAVPGVSRVRVRLDQYGTMPLPRLDEPVRARVMSAPPAGRAVLGDVQLHKGRWPARDDEALVLEAFAEAHDLALGARLPLIINGVLRRVKMVGIAASPEVLFSVAPGEFVPDPLRFAVLWMQPEALSELLEMKGAFNDVVFDLQRNANERAVIAEVSRLLRPYGGDQPYGRKSHASHSILLGELTQLQATARVMPAIFLGVAAFLISIVLGRIVQLQRTQIAVIKAVGYSNLAVGLHFVKLVLVIVALGTVLGIGGGAYLGGATMALYRSYFAIPNLSFHLDAGMALRAVAISATAASLGTLWAARRVVRLPPAEAMQPEPPAIYRRSLSDRLHLSALLGQSARMVLREAERNPLRFLLSTLGIAFAVALLVVGRFGFDAIDRYMEVTFAVAQRQDMTVTFADPQPPSVLRELAHLPGVLRVEGERTVPTRLRVGHRAREVVLHGYPPDSQLTQLVDSHGALHVPPTEGLLLTETLAKILEVTPGQTVEVTARAGSRPVRMVPVHGTLQEMFGLSGHMSLAGLHRMLGETPSLTMAYLRVEGGRRSKVLQALRERPEVLGVTQRDQVIKRFQEQTAGQMNVTTWIMALFAGVIAAGVVYNNARLALSTRSRDLASLRVLGFRRGEISALLLSELALQVLLALVPGMAIGTYLTAAMMSTADPEQYRFPLAISLQTYVFSALITFGAAAASALLVRRKLDHLDLISVLKTRE